MLYVARAAISTINGWHKSLNVFFHFAMKMCQLGGEGEREDYHYTAKNTKLQRYVFIFYSN